MGGRGRGPRLRWVLLAALAAGCGEFTPPDEEPAAEDLLHVARIAIQALRDRDYPRLYPLTSSTYRQGRSYEDFAARNRASEAAYRLGPCRLDQPGSRIGADRALLAFDTAFVFPPGASQPELPRRLIATFLREPAGWRLHDVATVSPAPSASPSPPAPGR